MRRIKHIPGKILYSITLIVLFISLAVEGQDDDAAARAQSGRHRTAGQSRRLRPAELEHPPGPAL